MKKIIINKPYLPFLITALISASIALLFKALYPESYFDLNIYDVTLNIYTSKIWFVFTGYLLLLSLIYFVATKKGLKTRRFLLITHYIFTLLFIVFFVPLNFLSYPKMHELFNEAPIKVLISIYAVILIIDVVLFLFSIFFLILNLFLLKKQS